MRFVAAAAFTNVHEAALAKSVLEAAGIETALADEHVVSMDWFYSNAVGGVKVVVPQDRLEEAQSLLRSRAVVTESPAADSAGVGDFGDTDKCQHCGSIEFVSRLRNKELTILSWWIFGFSLGWPVWSRYCRQCDEPDGSNKK